MSKKLNKTALAMSVLALHLNEWEPIAASGKFFIRHRKTDQYIGSGKTLKAAILKARDHEIKKLKERA